MNELVGLLGRELAEPPKTGVEVGVSCGETSAALLYAFPELTLWMVDSWETYPEVHAYRQSGDGHSKLTETVQKEHKAQAAELTDFAEGRRIVMHTSSLRATFAVPGNSLGFVYIDADHTYHAVMADIHFWWPKLKCGGLMVLDDFMHPRDKRGLFGVSRAAIDFTARRGLQLSWNEVAQKGWFAKA